MDPVVFEDFNGLRLLPEQGEAPGAVSMLNADLSRDKTQIGSRGGLALIGTGTANYHRISGLHKSIVQGALFMRLALARNTGSALQLEDITISTGVVATAASTWGSASTIATCIHLGGFTSGGVGAAGVNVCSRSGSTNENLRGYAGGSSSPVDLGFAPRYLATCPADGSIAAAHFSAVAGAPGGAIGAVTTGTESTVFFSSAGISAQDFAESTFASTDWIQLDPLDGDEITGMVTWRESLFVIKRSTLYVLGSVGIDADGGRDFTTFRRVELPGRTRVTANRGGENMIAGGDGVYLLLGDGVYRTTGDVPVLVSRDVSPLFNGTGNSASLFPSTGDWTLGYANNRLYLSYQNGSTYRTLVRDNLLGEWFLWDIAVGASAIPSNVIEWYDINELPTSYVASGAKVFSFSQTATSDAGTAITSSYQWGFTDASQPGATGYLRWARLWGSGAVTFGVREDYATTDPLSRDGTVTMGTAPAIAEAYHQKSYGAKRFSPVISASGAWTLTRLQFDRQWARQ